MKLLLCLFLFHVTTCAFKEPISPIYTAGRLKRTRSLNSYDTCFLEAPECDPSYKYRSYDGSCNNLDHPTWGMTNSAFLRLFEATYSDYIELPPEATDGSELPNARDLVNKLFPDKDVPDSVSLVVSQWSQLVAHDTATNLQKVGVADCCASDDRLICYPIPVPEDDPWFPQFNVTCLTFTRTQTTICGECTPNTQKVQINALTHGLDASQIYGSTSDVAQSIREHEGGRLTMRVKEDGRCFLPSSPDAGCYNSDVCYVAGDARVIQNTELAVLQTMFAREHNRIADALSAVHPDWDDETLYQESRKIVIAEYTHITYNEFLTFIITEEVVVKHGLKSLDKGYHKYDPEIPNISIVSFVNPAYRIFHSSLQGMLAFFNYHLEPTRYINLTDYMNSPDIVEEDNNFDELILGLITQPMQGLDNFYAAQFEEKLFHFGQPYGTDLTALDIQRARDWGAPTYTTALYGCTGLEVHDFDDLVDLWPAEALESVRGIYKSVDDIDLFVAINFENKLEGHRLTPVAECLVTEQFYRWKNGDRFWYEVEGQPHSFTPEQLDEIRKTSLSRLICDNSDNIVNVTSNAWLPPGDDNPIVPCETIPSVDLSKWI